MPLLDPDGGEATSNIQTGDGTNVATYTIGQSQRLSVESVVAEIDNTGGGDTIAKLIVRDPSGRVIATKTQGDTIPSGDTGSATFALRLDDSQAGAIRYKRLNTGGWLDVAVTGVNPATFYGVHIDNTGGGIWLFENNSIGDFRIYQNNGFLDIQGSHVAISHFEAASKFDMFSSGGYAIRVATGKSVTFYRDSGSANPIFRIDADGSLHGKTGKSLVFDL